MRFVDLMKRLFLPRPKPRLTSNPYMRIEGLRVGEPFPVQWSQRQNPDCFDIEDDDWPVRHYSGA